MLLNSRAAKGRCPVCGAEDASCLGDAEHHKGGLIIHEEGRMADEKLFLYEVTINGFPTRIKMTEKQAERRYPGATKVSNEDVSRTNADAPEDDTAKNDAGDTVTATDAKKREAKNKAVSAAGNK